MVTAEREVDGRTITRDASQFCVVVDGMSFEQMNIDAEVEDVWANRRVNEHIAPLPQVAPPMRMPALVVEEPVRTQEEPLPPRVRVPPQRLIFNRSGKAYGEANEPHF